MALLIFPGDYPIQDLQPSVSNVAYIFLVLAFYIMLATLEIYYNNIIRIKDEEISKLKISAEQTSE